MHSLSLTSIKKNISKKTANLYFFDSSTELTDRELIEKSINDDNKAFRHLIDRYIKSIYNFLYQITKDTSSLDDLSQETFIKIWKNLSRFDQSKNFKAWIFTIAKNTAYDFLKKKKNIPFSCFDDVEGNNKLEEICDDNPSLDELLEKKELEDKLEEKLKEIPDKHRLILLLHYKDDFSLSEISQILSVPYNTIKSRHQRATQSLRKVLLSDTNKQQDETFAGYK